MGDEGAEGALVLDADEAFDGFTIGVEEEGWDAADVGLLGQPGEGVDVDFRHGRWGVACEVGDDGFDHLTRPTPVRVEIDEYNVVLGRDFLEVFWARDVNGLAWTRFGFRGGFFGGVLEEFRALLLPKRRKLI